MVWSAYTPQESGHNSLGTRLSCRNIDLEVLNLSTLLSDKAKVDKETKEDEVKAQGTMVERERLYAGPTEKRVGASGASARTETVVNSTLYKGVPAIPCHCPRQ